jgi:hypothetical protein
MYDVVNRSTSGPGTSVPYSFIAGTTVIPNLSQNILVSINEIASLILGTQVHITATSNGDETLGHPTITATAGSNSLPATINSSGDIVFHSSVIAPATGIFIMYHIMYTTEGIPG